MNKNQSFSAHIPDLQFEGYNSFKPLFTGRYIVTLPDKLTNSTSLEYLLHDVAGMVVAHLNDFDLQAFDESLIDQVHALIFDNFGLAVIQPDNDQYEVINTWCSTRGWHLEPEQIHYIPEVLHDTMAQPNYGLEITKVYGKEETGKGVKVAVLDTGMDMNHPDFVHRKISGNSFVPNETVQDKNGHGTHCVGISCGYTTPAGRRYGIAKDAEIYVGKVLNDSGRGAQSWILSGIHWAIKSQCDIISMSLGSAVFPGQSHSKAYERVAKYALKNNTLIIAASGSESKRQQGIYNPIGSPANCPSILAVGAIDAQLKVANFSNRSLNPEGKVNLSAPGVNIYSSWSLPHGYKTLSGTCIAAPHVAGIAALFKEKHPEATAEDLWWHLTFDARKMTLSPSDVGAGLVQAP